MKYLLLILAYVLCASSTCFAQKYDGDWKGYYQVSNRYYKGKVEVIFHIAEGECSEEPSTRSPSDPKEIEMIIEEKEESVSIYSKTGSNSLVFRGRLINGKIKGIYYGNGAAEKITLTKFGKGVVTIERTYRIDKKSGMIIY